MRLPAVPIFLALLAGAACAFALPAWAMPWLAAGALAAWQLALVALVASRVLLFAAAALASIALSAGAAALHEDGARRQAPIRALVPAAGSARGDIVRLEGTLVEDAAPRGEGVAVRLAVERAGWGRTMVPLTGGVSLSVGGDADPARWRAWTRGRRVTLPASLRHPARHLNDGVADGELASLRRGVALVGSVKSASLVDVTARASPADESLARVRARVRRAVGRALAHDADAAAVVAAILIGDRAGLTPEIESRLQRAGTFHVIAISGGNVALFAMLAWGLARLLAGARRPAIAAAIVMVAAYGALVGAGASVGRAVMAALLVFSAMLFDHRAPPLNVLAVVGIVFVSWDPLALADVGFLLSFGATAGILVAAPVMGAAAARRPGLPAAGLAVVAATAAAEIALLPIQATAFHRVTVAGLALNLVAIPAMSLVQMAGMALVAFDAAGASHALDVSASIARASARVLTESARLIDIAPRLSWRVAAPPWWLVSIYAAACAAAIWGVRPALRRATAAVACAAALMMALSAAARPPGAGRLVLTMFDVGQAEAMALCLPSGRVFLIDAAGPPGRFDIADRVLVPALLARGAGGIDALVVTHPDVDHLGGASGVITDLRPRRLLEGVAPARHVEREAIVRLATAAGLTVEALRAGATIQDGRVRVQVLHPPPPDWERQRVRNDDSLVLEVVFDDVSLLLTGDAGEAVERDVAARLSAVPIRILKAGHHGSRTSTSAAFVAAARPVATLISAGRGNLYGHPSEAVVRRLESQGSAVFRTDRDGQIDVITDGRDVEVRTWSGRRWRIVARGPVSARGGG